MKRKLLVAAGWIVTLVCLALFFRKVDWSAMGQAVLAARWWMFLPVLAVYLTGYLTRAWRWHFLLRTIKQVPFRTLFSVLVIGFMANNILPARIGEVVRAVLFGRKERISKSASFSTILIERVFDGLTIVLYFGLGLSLVWAMLTGMRQEASLDGQSLPLEQYRHWILLGAGVSLAVFTAVMAVCVGMIVFRKQAQVVLGWIFSRAGASVKKQASRYLDRFISGFAVLRNTRDLSAVVGLSLLSWGLEAASYYLTALAFNIQLTVPMVLLVMGAANLAILIPSTPGGLGIFEFTGLVVLLSFSIPADPARLYILAVHAVILLPITALGLYYLWKDHLSLGEIQKDE